MSGVNLQDLDLQDEEIVLADDSSYVDPQEFPPPLDDGTYLLSQGEPDFTPSKKPNPDGSKNTTLKANLTHTVANGEFAGRQVRDFSLSNKAFERNGVKVSQMKDHLRATGDRNNYTSTQQAADALVAATGKLFKAKLQWQARTKDAKHEVKGKKVPYQVKGQSKFPIDPQTGKRIPEIEIEGETCTAFSVITFRFPA